MKKELKIELKSLKYFCPNLEKDIDVNISSCSFSSSSQECDICGSHGDITLYIDNACECGKFHDLEIRSW